MVAKRVLVIAAGAVAAAALIRRRIRSPSPQMTELHPGRWRVVTIYASENEVAPAGEYPQPLQELGALVEVRMRQAPGDKGTELAARLHAGEPTGSSALLGRLSGNDPRQAVRRALRETKQLVEAGEIMRLDPKPEGHRPATPAGKVTDVIAERSMGEGVL